MRQPSRQDLAAHDRLKAELRIRGNSLAQIARDLAVSYASVTPVGKGFQRSSRIERALAEAVGMTPEALFSGPLPGRKAMT